MPNSYLSLSSSSSSFVLMYRIFLGLPQSEQFCQLRVNSVIGGMSYVARGENSVVRWANRSELEPSCWTEVPAWVQHVQSECGFKPEASWAQSHPYLSPSSKQHLVHLKLDSKFAIFRSLILVHFLSWNTVSNNSSCNYRTWLSWPAEIFALQGFWQ